MLNLNNAILHVTTIPWWVLWPSVTWVWLILGLAVVGLGAYMVWMNRPMRKP